MGHIIDRNLDRAAPVADSARGIFVRDIEGNTYIDASGSVGVSSLGHGHPDVLAAMHRQIDRCAYTHTAFCTSETAERLAATLVAKAPRGISQAWFASSGSEAMETALKLARQYFVECGEEQRTVFIARRQSDHGSTLGALSLSGNERRRRAFAPLLMEVPRVSPCYEYRGRADDETVDEYTQRLVDELETAILRVGPGNVIAFCAETVVGAPGGAIPPTPGYFRKVRQLCDRYGILLILDEAMCGMGRTGTMFAIEQDDVAPDIITVAKGLGAGYQPIGAVLAQEAIVERLRHGSGIFMHGYAYAGHPVACAAALAVQQVIERDNLLAQVRKRGASLRRMLGEALGQHPQVGDIRGRGLFMALELVHDRVTKSPFPRSRMLHAKVKAEAMARGLIVYPVEGTIDGLHGDHVLVAPPFIASTGDLAEIVGRLAESIDAALRS